MVSRPVRLTRQVVSRSAPVGKNVRSSKSSDQPFELRDCEIPLSAEAVQSCGPGAFHPDKRAVARLCEEFRVNKGTKQCIADIAFKTPEALRLSRRQTKPGHFYELTLDPLKHVIDAHRAASRRGYRKRVAYRK